MRMQGENVVLEGGERHAFDATAYDGQREQVLAALQYGEQNRIRYKLPDLAVMVGVPRQNTTGISARIRELRREKYGSHKISKQYVSKGLYEYWLEDDGKW